MKFIWFILFTVLTNAAAQLMLKQGMTMVGPLNITAENAIIRVFQILFQPWVFAGLVVFVISMVSHLFVLTKVELSFAYPFISLAFVTVTVFAVVFFGEEINQWRILGIALICLGTFFVAKSDTSQKQALASEVIEEQQIGLNPDTAGRS